MQFEAASDNELIIGCAVRSVLRAPRSTALCKILTLINDSTLIIGVIQTAAKEEMFSSPMMWTVECVPPLAASVPDSGVYPKTRVMGSREKTLHYFGATAPLSVELHWGCENPSLS